MHSKESCALVHVCALVYLCTSSCMYVLCNLFTNTYYRLWLHFVLILSFSSTTIDFRVQYTIYIVKQNYKTETVIHIMYLLEVVGHLQTHGLSFLQKN